MALKFHDINNENLSDLVVPLRKFADAKSRTGDFNLGEDWIFAMLEHLEKGLISGILAYEKNDCRGFIIYKSGVTSIYLSIFFVRRGDNRIEILEKLLCHFLKSCRHTTILVTDFAPDISTGLQLTVLERLGLEKIDRNVMEFKAEYTLPSFSRPRGFTIRRYHESFREAVSVLEIRAYRGQVDQVILDVLRDIGNISASIRIAESSTAQFDTGLSAFAFRENQLAGAIFCTKKGRELNIANIAIDPDFQGQGLGQALLGRALRGMAAAGYRNCTLAVSAENTPAVNLYKKFKFKLKRNCPMFVYRTGSGV